jgi:hypothetical protein
MSFRPTPWASQQKSRVEALYVPPCEATRLKQFEVALAELPPRVINPKQVKEPAKKRGQEKNSRPESFWGDSVVRPLVADNLARGRPWYQGFVDLMRSTGEWVAFENNSPQKGYEESSR